MSKRTEMIETPDGANVVSEGAPAHVLARLIPLCEIAAAGSNTRTLWDDAKLSDLAEDIRLNGLLQPIVVRQANARLRDEGKNYEVVIGSRRFEAIKSLGASEIAATVRDIPDGEVAFLQLAENSKRCDITPLEEAQALLRLTDDGHSAEQIAARISMSPRHVYARLELLKLSATVQDALRDGQITAGHAALLAPLPDEDQVRLAAECVRAEWSVRALRDALKLERGNDDDCAGGAATESTPPRSEPAAAGGSDPLSEHQDEMAREDVAQARAEARELPDGETTRRDGPVPDDETQAKRMSAEESALALAWRNEVITRMVPKIRGDTASMCLAELAYRRFIEFRTSNCRAMGELLALMFGRYASPCGWVRDLSLENATALLCAVEWFTFATPSVSEFRLPERVAASACAVGMQDAELEQALADVKCDLAGLPRKKPAPQKPAKKKPSKKKASKIQVAKSKSKAKKKK